MQPFSIQCTTCRRSLRVVNPEAIGHILACPKCGSMVLIEPPSGWHPDAAGGAVSGDQLIQTTAGSGIQSIAVTPQLTAVPGIPLETSVAAALEMLAPRPPSAQQPQSSPVQKQSAVQEPATVDIPPPEKASPWKNPPSDSVSEPVGTSSVAKTAKPEPEAIHPDPKQSVAQSAAGGFAAVAPWPRWFWPGVAAVVIASALILAVRVMLRPDNPGNAPVVATSAPAPNAPSENLATDPPKAPPLEDPAPSQAVQHEVLKPADQTPPPPAQDAVVPSPTPTPAASTVADTPAASGPADAPNVQAPQVAVPRTLLRLPPRAVNINARLADSISGLEIRGLPLADFLAMVSQLSTIPITLDADAVLQLGQQPTAPVQVIVSNSTVADALETAIEPLRLGYQVREGQLIVGHAPQADLRKVRYAVADLESGNVQSIGELATLVRRMVAPDSWQSRPAGSGKATMVAGNGALLVEQTEAAHAQILTFCEKLRVARGLPLKSRFDPSRFALNTREGRAHEMLHRPITANFLEPQPLSNVAKWIHQTTGASILIDHAALAGQELSAVSQCTVAAVNKPLAAVLDEVTNPMELAWRAIDEQTIEITTRPAAATRMDVEFYPVAALATNSATGEMLIAQIKAKVTPQWWGDRTDKAGIHFDVPSGSLIVRAPQRVQAQLESYLASARSKK